MNTAKPFRAKLFHNKRHPILKLPKRKKAPELPEARSEVVCTFDVADKSETLVLRFAKIAVNAGWEIGDNRQTNRLGPLLLRLFGPKAGQPGTSHYVIFTPTASGGFTVTKEDTKS